MFGTSLFDETVLLYLLLEGKLDLFVEVLSLLLKIIYPILLLLKIITELLALYKSGPQPTIALIKFLFALDQHHLSLGAVGETDLLPEGELGEHANFVFVGSQVDGLDQIGVDEVGIGRLVSSLLLLLPSG